MENFTTANNQRFYSPLQMFVRSCEKKFFQQNEKSLVEKIIEWKKVEAELKVKYSGLDK